MPNSPQILFNKYTVLEVLKKDEYSGVYLALDRDRGRKVIIKTLNTLHLKESTLLARFQREAKILAKLDHPNIIKVLESGSGENQYYVVFEHFKSKNLRQLLNDKTLTEEQKKFLIGQLICGIHAAHKNGIVHRDLKPDNILVNSSLYLKIVDFGLAFEVNEPLLTVKTPLIGTPGYMSPEQIRGEQASAQSDLFALGIIIFEIFTGTNPFLQNDINSTINRIMNFDESEIPGNAELPDSYRSIVSGLIKKSRRSRTKSAEELIKFLNIREITPDEIVEDAEESPPSGKLRYFLATGIVIFLVSITYYIISNFLVNGQTTIITPRDTLQTITSPQVTNDNRTESLSENSEPLNSKAEENTATESSPELISSQKPVDEPANPLTYGRVFIECSPWALVYIDSLKIDTTPFKDYIPVSTGRHSIRLEHPDYPDYQTYLTINKDESVTLKVNLDKEFAGLIVKVNPWGDVYIDGKHYGQTPLDKPIFLTEGSHKIRITNPGYKEANEIVSLKKGEKMEFRYNFESAKFD